MKNQLSIRILIDIFFCHISVYIAGICYSILYSIHRLLPSVIRYCLHIFSQINIDSVIYLIIGNRYGMNFALKILLVTRDKVN